MMSHFEEASPKLMLYRSATPVPFGRGRGKPVNVPDHPPPPGYLCYRCREKGLSFPSRSVFESILIRSHRSLDTSVPDQQ